MLCWQDLVCLSDAELARLDIAEVNLACAVGLPGAERIDVPECLGILDGWAQFVARETSRLSYLFERGPGDYGDSWAYFRVLAMVTVLQRDLGLHGDPSSVEREHFPDSEETFIHGVCRRKTGTCAVMPVAYASVGRRLGYPIKLVSSQIHLFARWDDGTCDRFNIECTCRGLVCYSDEHYLSWPVGTPQEHVEIAGYLKSMTRREELKQFLLTRGFCLEDHGRYREAAEVFAWVASMAPTNAINLGTLHNLLARWNHTLRRLRPEGFPPLGIDIPIGLFPELPWELVGKFLHLAAVERSIQDPLEDLDSKHPCDPSRDYARQHVDDVDGLSAQTYDALFETMRT